MHGLGCLANWRFDNPIPNGENTKTMTLERDEQVERLFHAALELEPAAREAFLRQSCGDDESLRLGVENLLKNHQRAGNFLDALGRNIAALPGFDSEAEVVSGQQLGHYRMLSPLGKGGMGEVWLAQDQRLGRKAALKLLPANLTGNRDRLHRFELEARAASALNHPNILTIYEIGEDHGIHFIATEFIDGSTLRHHAAGRGLPQVEAIEIAIQIASALNAAHEAGIIHRDIKPENVMLRRDGLVKVLDFGLAKLTEMLPGTLLHDSQVSTQARVETVPGTVLGTPRYMSPEQARGQSLDARTDVFSLGVVLYEMLTGQPPFSGENSVEVLAAILEREPLPLSQHLPDAPPELVRVVHKSLLKRREERYQFINDLWNDLKDLKEDLSFEMRRIRKSGNSLAKTDLLPASLEPPLQPVSFRQRFIRVPAILLTLLLVLAAGLIGWWLMTRRNAQVGAPPPATLKLVEAARWRGTPGETYSIGSLSPDGRWVAFVSSEIGGRNLWLKQLSSEVSQAFPVTKDEYRNDLPLWSPSGDELAYFSVRGDQGVIWRMPFSGGTPTFIKAERDPSIKLKYWSSNGEKIYYEASGNLFALGIKTGQTVRLTNFDASKLNISSISISPNEQQIAYITSDADQHYRLWVAAASEGGNPVQVAEEATAARNTVWHPDNRRIIYSAYRDGVYQLFVADIDGHRPTQLTFGKTDCYALDVSRDGSKILYGSSIEESDIWGARVADSQEFAVASDVTAELWPDVSPDGRMIAYQSFQSMSQGSQISAGAIMAKASVADDLAEKPFKLSPDGVLPKWSPDGKQVVFLRLDGADYHLWSVAVTGGELHQMTVRPIPPIDRSVLPYLRYQTSYFMWSPDGSKLVYRTLSEPRSIWMMNSDGTGDTQISANQEAGLELDCPLWASDGKHIAYSTRGNADASGKRAYAIWLADSAAKTAKQLYSAESELRLIGWAPKDQGLILASIQPQNALKVFNGVPADVDLKMLSVTTGELRQIVTLPSAYFYNIHLAPDQKTVAFSSRRDGKDNIWVLQSNGIVKQLTANPDTRFYFSSLAWAPDARTIYFGKQTRHNSLGLVTNFK